MATSVVSTTAYLAQTDAPPLFLCQEGCSCLRRFEVLLRSSLTAAGNLLQNNTTSLCCSETLQTHTEATAVGGLKSCTLCRSRCITANRHICLAVYPAACHASSHNLSNKPLSPLPPTSLPQPSSAPICTLPSYGHCSPQTALCRGHNTTEGVCKLYIIYIAHVWCLQCLIVSQSTERM